jgi:hypothetical protein
MDARDVGRPHFPVRENVGVPGLLDVRVEPQYDFLQVAKNTATVKQTLFSIPQGQSYTPTGGSVLTKNLYHTSLVFASQMDAPRKLLVKALSGMIDPAMVPTDINAAIFDYVVQFIVQSKEFWQGHLAKCPGGAGTFFSSGFNGATTASTGSAALYFGGANGWPTAQNYSPIVDDSQPPVDATGTPMPKITGVLLESGQQFNLVLDPTLQGAGTGFTTSNLSAAANGYLSPGVTILFYLEGITYNPVV